MGDLVDPRTGKARNMTWRELQRHADSFAEACQACRVYEATTVVRHLSLVMRLCHSCLVAVRADAKRALKHSEARRPRPPRRQRLCETCKRNHTEFPTEDECPWCIEKRREQ